jgi:hypothetical protein
MSPKRRPSGPSGKHTAHRVIVAIPSDRLAIYRAAAERHGLTLSAWLRLAADRQAERKTLG